MKKADKYEICLSVDLRCFNNAKPDMGVRDYFDVLGYIPHRLFNHETYMDQIHTHTGVIDDEYLEAQWVSQRAMPGAQRWTKRQYKSLIDEVHKYGVKFYQGAEAAWSRWPEYGEINRCTYIYDKLPEIFIVGRNGKTTGESAMGAINPLRRFKDGTLYEDMIIRDLKRFLVDYECDGFFAADGFAGLAVPIKDGCYADDMIDQFTQYTGIDVPAGSTPQRAEFIWSKYSYEWAVFYSDRWADFYKKLSTALTEIGKELTAFTPWQMGPADSLLEYGFDYGKIHRAGVKYMTLEMMEEVTSRRFQCSTGWEAVCISNAVTAKAQAEGLKLLWTTSTCNCPEHWHTLRDQPSIIEREALALGASGTIDSNGSLVRAVDGVLTIFGIDLVNSEWNWLKRRWDEGFSYEPSKILGLTIVWSDKILYEHLRRGSKWPVSSAVSRLRYAGIPISQGVNLDNIEVLPADASMLLVEPFGLDDDDIKRILSETEKGRCLVVVGDVENELLLNALGIKRSVDKQGAYEAATAKADAFTPDGSLAVSTNRYGNGSVVYVNRLVKTLPALKTSRSSEEERAYPVLIEDTTVTPVSTIRELMTSIITIHPDSLDLAAAKAVQTANPSWPSPSSGQILAFEKSDSSQVVLVENSANLMYTPVSVKLPKDKKVVMEYPEIRPIGPVGYLYFNDVNPRSFEVCVPPDACIPIHVVYK